MASNIPDEFLCPISHEIIKEPIKLNCSHIFDKDHIYEWLEKSQTCPICRKGVLKESFKVDLSFKNSIEKFLNEHKSAGVTSTTRNGVQFSYSQINNVTGGLKNVIPSVNESYRLSPELNSSFDKNFYFKIYDESDANFSNYTEVDDDGDDEYYDNYDEDDYNHNDEYNEEYEDENDYNDDYEDDNRYEEITNRTIYQHHIIEDDDEFRPNYHDNIEDEFEEHDWIDDDESEKNSDVLNQYNDYDENFGDDF